jgi:hypothetical protein
VQLHAFVNVKLVEDKWSASRPGLFITEEKRPLIVRWEAELAPEPI